jgi:hypothetical protein
VAADDEGDDLARLRQQPENVHLLGGFGPLVVGAVLFVLMVLLAPTIAPERVVEEPVGGTTTTTLELATTTTTTTIAPAAPGSTEAP